MKIIEEPLPICTEPDWTMQIENTKECYNFTIDEDENPQDINIPEFEGSHTVVGPPLECPEVTAKLRSKEINIELEAELKLASIRDY